MLNSNLDLNLNCISLVWIKKKNRGRNQTQLEAQPAGPLPFSSTQSIQAQVSPDRPNSFFFFEFFLFLYYFFSICQRYMLQIFFCKYVILPPIHLAEAWSAVTQMGRGPAHLPPVHPAVTSFRQMKQWHAAMTCVHGRCSSFSFWHEQMQLSVRRIHSCTCFSRRPPIRHLSLHITS